MLKSSQFKDILLGKEKSRIASNSESFVGFNCLLPVEIWPSHLDLVILIVLGNIKILINVINLRYETTYCNSYFCIAEWNETLVILNILNSSKVYILFLILSSVWLLTEIIHIW